jgi:uncharacterized membrane-anchored protein
MTTTPARPPLNPSLNPSLNKVPEVTLYFWVIKILCTTVGETAADFLNVNLNLGLTGTSLITGVLLVLALILQFAVDRYRPVPYWLAVALVSVFGTLVTDNLSDAGVPLETSTVVFGALLAGTFLAWYRAERTLSIHSIVTPRREGFYWAAILFTFALGTATGDLMAEVLGLGYLATGIIVAVLITVLAVGWRLGLHPVLAFWAIYVLTRPLGASIGDYLSQPVGERGLGLGPTTTSAIFTVGIVVIVGYLAVTGADVIERRVPADATGRHGLAQTVVVLAVLLVASGVGYTIRKSALLAEAPAPASGSTAPGPGQVVRTTPLGDLSRFRTIARSTLELLDRGDQAGATTRVADLETTWDDAEARLKPRDERTWTELDGKIDTVLRELRSTHPRPASEKAALAALLTALG